MPTIILQQMQQSRNDTKTDYQLLAIRTLIKEGHLPQAQQRLRYTQVMMMPVRANLRWIWYGPILLRRRC